MTETWPEYVQRITAGPEKCTSAWVGEQALLLEKTFREALQTNFLVPAAYVLQEDEEDGIFFCSWDTSHDHVEVEVHPESATELPHLSWFGRSWVSREYWGEDMPTAGIIPGKAVEMLRRIIQDGAPR